VAEAISEHTSDVDDFAPKKVRKGWGTCEGLCFGDGLLADILAIGLCAAPLGTSTFAVFGSRFHGLKNGNEHSVIAPL